MSHINPFVWFSGLFLLSACGTSIPNESSSALVIGGQNATAPSYFAALHKSGADSPFCGATVIDNEHLLTAAHCVSSSEEAVSVWVGLDNLSQPGEAYSVDLVRIHPQYHNGSFHHDLAMLTVSRLPQSKAPNVLLLSEGDKTPEHLKIYGFGNIARKDQIYPDQLQSAVINYVPHFECQKLGGVYSQVREEQICAGDVKYGAFDSCDGDSGGPLIAQESYDTLYGIVSWGTGCGLARRPGVYTRISAYREWIEQEKNGLYDLPLGERVQALFYYPLYHTTTLAEGQLRVRRFNAAYQEWKESSPDPANQVLQTWQRSWDGQIYKIDLIELTSQRYRLRLTHAGKVYEVQAFFSEKVLKSAEADLSTGKWTDPSLLDTNLAELGLK